MRWLGNLGLMVVTTGVVLATAEAVLVFVVPPPIVWRYPQESYEYDEIRWHRPKAHLRAFTHSAPVWTNSRGLRNEEVSDRPRPGVLRILCMGDSLTFGNGVHSSETYPKQLEAMLNRAGGTRYEVINAGVPAYDTWQEVAYLREEGIRLAPDLVVVGFYGNDIVPRPEQVPSKSTAVSEEGVARRMMYWLKRSRVVMWVYERGRRLKNQVRPSSGVSHERALLTGTPNSFNEAGFREIERSFGELAELAREHRFELLVVLFPLPNQLIRTYPDSMYPRRVVEIASRYGIPTLDLMPAFEQEFRGLGSLFIEWDGHPNPRGYAIAAREIRDHMLRTANSGPLGRRQRGNTEASGKPGVPGRRLGTPVRSAT
ncbi:MAG: SGNH/GDSL hydrolase family protein [Candidatus Rokuibacteriota bacterium]